VTCVASALCALALASVGALFAVALLTPATELVTVATGVLTLGTRLATCPVERCVVAVTRALARRRVWADRPVLARASPVLVDVELTTLTTVERATLTTGCTAALIVGAVLLTAVVVTVWAVPAAPCTVEVTGAVAEVTVCTTGAAAWATALVAPVAAALAAPPSAPAAAGTVAGTTFPGAVAPLAEPTPMKLAHTATAAAADVRLISTADRLP
jgi:hypothetical protein